MIRLPINSPGPTRKLVVQWMKGSGAEGSTRVMVTWCSLQMEPSLDDQCQDWLETSEFSKNWWERSKVEFDQAELLNLLPAPVPIRLAGDTDTDQLAEEQDRAAQKRANLSNRGRPSQGRD